MRNSVKYSGINRKAAPIPPFPVLKLLNPNKYWRQSQGSFFFLQKSSLNNQQHVFLFTVAPFSIFTDSPGIQLVLLQACNRQWGHVRTSHLPLPTCQPYVSTYVSFHSSCIQPPPSSIFFYFDSNRSFSFVHILKNTWLEASTCNLWFPYPFLRYSYFRLQNCYIYIQCLKCSRLFC